MSPNILKFYISNSFHSDIEELFFLLQAYDRLMRKMRTKTLYVLLYRTVFL